MLSSRGVTYGFESHSDHTKDCKIGIWCFFGGVMDSMFALSVVDRGIELRSGQTKDTAHSIKEKEQRLVSLELG